MICSPEDSPIESTFGQDRIGLVADRGKRESRLVFTSK